MDEQKETTKEKMLSRQFLGHLTFSAISTVAIIWLVCVKCNLEPFDHENAYKYIDLWGELNLWNLIGFGSMNGLKSVAQYLPNRRGQ